MTAPSRTAGGLGWVRLGSVIGVLEYTVGSWAGREEAASCAPACCLAAAAWHQPPPCLPCDPKQPCECCAWCRYFICDQKLAALGWKERTSWEQGVRQTVDWYLSHSHGEWWDARELVVGQAVGVEEHGAAAGGALVHDSQGQHVF